MKKPNWFTRIKNSKKVETRTLLDEVEQAKFCEGCGTLLCGGELCGPSDNALYEEKD